MADSLFGGDGPVAEDGACAGTRREAIKPTRAATANAAELTTPKIPDFGAVASLCTRIFAIGWLLRPALTR